MSLVQIVLPVRSEKGTKPYMYIMGIETSCDESSVAIVDGDYQLLAEVTAGQEDVHQRFGGIVPELASRKHLESLLPTLKVCLEKAELDYEDISAVAVTNRPGLVGSLMVGVMAAKTISYAMEIPLVPINHLQAHLAAIELTEKVAFPVLGLIVSGGHTSLYRIEEGWRNFQLLGQTRDDAAGEAFDKGARLLNLGYPGGPLISKLAETGNAHAVDFPRALPQKSTLDFSFSGLKTSLLYYLQKQEQKPEGQHLADVCASYQEAIADALVRKVKQAAATTDFRQVVVAGGVAANRRLREKLKEQLPKNIKLSIPPIQHCTDNGAMIACLGLTRLRQNQFLEAKAVFSVLPSSQSESEMNEVAL